MLTIPPQRLQLGRLASPLGELLLVSDEAGRLRALDYHDYQERMARLLQRHYPGLAVQDGTAPLALRRALDGYFGGELEAIAGLVCATAGTEFQRRIWTALRHIPAGTTLRYGELAGRLGQPRAVRAVGAANGANPIAVVVPCHRLIGADGALTGYAGGLARKRWLLEHEARVGC